MPDEIRLAVVGVGRIGAFHALHAQEVAAGRGDVALRAVVDGHGDTAERVAADLQRSQRAPIRAFHTVEEALAAGAIDAAIVASRTEDHEHHTRALVDAGRRVLLEKPLANSLAEAEALAGYLDEDRSRRRAVMQAFQRRFDAPLAAARELVEEGAVGRPFKVVSVLEDPEPPPRGYQSAGLLVDMSVHNTDEVMWFLGARPERAAAFGARLYNTSISPVEEDFDDGFLQLWFPEGRCAQIQVSRNHVAGYRNETWIFGEEGAVQVGHFRGEPLEVTLEAYGRSGAATRRSFAMRDYGRPVPVFLERFGPAYRAEVAEFIGCVVGDRDFPVTHDDGLWALRVAEAGARAVTSADGAAPV